MSKVKLIDVCDFQGGSQPPKNEWIAKPQDGYIRMLQIRDFTQSRNVDIEYVRYTEKTKICNNDDILIARYGASIGKILTGLSGAYNVAIMKTVPDITRLSKNYLMYYLMSDVFQEFIKNVGSRAAQAGFNKEELSALSIPLPSLETQAKIASTLDKVTHTIDLCNQIIEKLDLLVKARFVEMFGDTESNNNNYPIHRLDSLCVVSSSKRIYQDEQSSSGVPFIRISNLVELIENNQFGCDLFIPEEKYNELLKNDLVPKAGDILVTSRGTLGKCYIVQDDDKFYFQDGMISWIYNLDKSITPLYLTFLFNTKDIKRQIDNLQSGSTVAYLSITMLKKLNIVVPPLAQQEQFADFVKQTDKSKSAVKQVLEKAETLKKALMQEHFG